MGNASLFVPAVIPEGLPRSRYHLAVERHFQQLRGSSDFVLSPADWSLVGRWQDSSIPLAVVLRGLDAAFLNHGARRLRHETVNSLAYCSRHVLAEWAKLDLLG